MDRKPNNVVIVEDHEECNDKTCLMYLYAHTAECLQKKIDEYFSKYPYNTYDTMVVASTKQDRRSGLWECVIQRFQSAT